MRALISVSDKTGVIDLADGLVNLGVEIVSTGGTMATLKAAGIPVISVEDVTGFRECLNGRVKTLHPAIHGGLLAVRDNKDHMDSLNDLNILPIDIAVVNLYPFKETVLKESVGLHDALENIDVGGPSILRAAAKNYKYVSVVCDPKDYESLLNGLRKGSVTEEDNFRFAVKAFEHTAYYDAMISSYLRETLMKNTSGSGNVPSNPETFPEKLTVTFEKVANLRYGENPHQKAVFYREPLIQKGTVVTAEKLHGKELSFNNINDANGAIALIKEFSVPTVVAIKHANPCGVGSGEDIFEAYMKAYETDKMSIYGGIIASNREIDSKTAREINKIFVELIIAPSFTEEALNILTTKKNIRVLALPGISRVIPDYVFDYKRVQGGILVQTPDNFLLNNLELRFVTDRKPTSREMEDLIFSFKVVKHVTSNAIVIGKNEQSVGIGPGQTNRIWACRQAIEHGQNHLGDEAVKGAVMASDAYFPFPDCVIEAADAGITAIIQPGGSKNDDSSINFCNENNVAMVFTGYRHFKH